MTGKTQLRDGLAGDFAHVGWSAYQTKDPYSDVVIHEAAHMLHYLKPQNFGFLVRRGQERFVDIEFRYRELFSMPLARGMAGG